MPLRELLKVGDDVLLAEDSFEGLELGLKSLEYLDKLERLPGGSIEQALKVKTPQGEPLGIAFKNRHPEGDFWLLLPCPHAAAPRKLLAARAARVLAAGVPASTRTRKVAAEQLWKAIRAYMSICLAERALCDCDKELEPLSFAKNDERGRRIKGLLDSLAGRHGYRLGQLDALEICCGNGMSTVPLRALFRSVLSVDNDKCALCNGLHHGTLEPEQTMLADARALSRHGLGGFDAVLGFMLGTIYEFNKAEWRTIFTQSYNALRSGGFLLFTVRTQEEMGFVSDAFASMGVKGEVIDNRQNDSIYDSWAFFTVKE